MKKIQCIARIKEYLKDVGRPCTTVEIYDYINSVTKYGLTIQSLCNVLSKNYTEFVRVGTDLRPGNVSGNYPIAVWDLSESMYNKSGC